MVDTLALVRGGDAELDTGGFQRVAVDRAVHQRAGAQDSEAFVIVALGFVRDLDRDVQPGARRAMGNQIESLVNGVDGSNEKVGASFGQFLRGGEHEFRDSGPIVGVDAVFVLNKGMAVHRHFGVVVGAEQVRALNADGAIAERGAFRAGCDDADV